MLYVCIKNLKTGRGYFFDACYVLLKSIALTTILLFNAIDLLRLFFGFFLKYYF